MKILFWLNGSGGDRREREIVEFKNITTEDFFKNKFRLDIEEELEAWKEELNCHSQVVYWGWDENFNSETEEPLSPSFKGDNSYAVHWNKPT